MFLEYGLSITNFLAWTAPCFFLFFFLFLQASIDTGFFLVFTSERISGRYALRNFSKDDTYDLAVFALLASIPAGLHVLGIRD
jgi:hypothetical protein